MRKKLEESVLIKDREKVIAYRGQLLDSMASAIHQIGTNNIEQAKEHLDDVELIIQKMEQLHEEKLIHERANRKLQSDLQEVVRQYAVSIGHEKIFGFDITFLMGREDK